MVSPSTANLAGIIVTISIVAIGGTNFAFAQQPTCGEQPSVYNIGCTPLGTAQLYGAILVAGVVAFTIACGAAGIKYHTVP